MKFRALMVVKATVCLLIGLPVLIIPKPFYGFFGIDLSGPGAYFPGMLYGASLVGNMFLAWMGRNAVESAGRRAIIWDLAIYDALGFIITLVMGLTGKANTYIWAPVGLYLLLTLGFGYFLFRPPRP